MEIAPTAVPAVLDLGAAVLLHGMLEHELDSLRHPLLDDVVRAQLQREHDEFAEDLELLDSLWRQEPSSSDLASLSAAVLERLKQHLAKDQRMTYDPLERRQVSDPNLPEADGS